MTTLPTMRKYGYRSYTCPECGHEPFWIHKDDGDDTEVVCPNCAYQTTAGDVRNRD